MLRGFAASAVGCLAVTWLWMVLVSADSWWPIAAPLALSTATALALLLWPARRRLGVGVLLGTVLAAVADYILVIVIVLYIGDVAVT